MEDLEREAHHVISFSEGSFFIGMFSFRALSATDGIGQEDPYSRRVGIINSVEEAFKWL